MSQYDALTSLAREESGRVLALLARQLDDVDLADEAVQDALLEAVRTWPVRGVPANPPAWLMTVARNKARDRLRRRAAARRRSASWSRDLLEAGEAAEDRGLMEDTADTMEIRDERLRLMLLCCHPALNPDAQVALTLRLVGGLTTDEIAAAYVVPEPTISQRIVRAKRKIRDARIPLSLPADLAGRVGTLLTVLYLVFNEAYLSRREEDGILRPELADEAIRLTRLTGALLDADDQPDAWAEASALLALELFQRARFATRLDPTGALVALPDQDRTRWDAAMIREANHILTGALRLARPGPFQVQAVIAGHHANARTSADTDWAAITTAYTRLTELTDTPIVRLNHAVAVGRADGPQAGLRMLGTVRGLDDYHLFHAVRADLDERAGDLEGAAAAYERALGLVAGPVERRHLETRLAAVRRDLGSAP